MNPQMTYPLDVKLMNGTAAALFVAFIFLTLSFSISWILKSPWFAIGKIRVSGDFVHTNSIALRSNVAPKLNGTFVTLDLANARQVFEAVPWVRQAVVKREFPNRLSVSLKEHVAVAYWGNEGAARLLNNFGEVFEANLGEVEQDSLPRLNGQPGQGALVLAVYQSLQPLFANLDLVVDQIELTGRGSWEARLDTGAVLQLGRGSAQEVFERTEKFTSTLTQVIRKYGRNPEALESADLRHEDGYAIRLRGVTTLVPAQGNKQ